MEMDDVIVAFHAPESVTRVSDAAVMLQCGIQV
jgi:hypothetical protein